MVDLYLTDYLRDCELNPLLDMVYWVSLLFKNDSCILFIIQHTSQEFPKDIQQVCSNSSMSTGSALPLFHLWNIFTSHFKLRQGSIKFEMSLLAMVWVLHLFCVFGEWVKISTTALKFWLQSYHSARAMLCNERSSHHFLQCWEPSSALSFHWTSCCNK